MKVYRRQARSRGAVRTVSLAGAVAISVVCSLTLAAAKADAAVPAFMGPTSPNGAPGANLPLGTDLTTGTDSSASETLAEYYSTHPLMEGTDADFATYTTGLSDAFKAKGPNYQATVDGLSERFGGNASASSVDVAQGGVNLAVTGDIAGGDAVVDAVAAAALPAGAEAAGVSGLATALGTAGPVGLVVGAIGIGLKYEWGHFAASGNNKPDTYYTVAPSLGAVLNINQPCGFQNLYTGSTARPCASAAYHGDLVSDPLACANGPCSVPSATTISAVLNGEAQTNRGNAISAQPILAGGLPGESLTVGYSGNQDPGDLGTLDRDASVHLNATANFVYDACNGGYPYQCDPGTQLGSAANQANVFTGITSSPLGIDLGPEHSESRWMSYRERCYSPGQQIFEYLDFRGPVFDPHAPNGAMTGAPCPVDTMTGHPGNLVGVTVVEMPSITPLVVWAAPAKYLDNADPYYRCNAGNSTGNPCQVAPADPTHAVTPDTGPNPCTYGGVVIAEADCVAADASVWTTTRTAVRGKNGTDVAPYSAPDPNQTASPAPQPSSVDQPGEASTATSPSSSCFPSGWAVFNPVQWVEKPVGCALTEAFVPSDTEIQTDTDDLQSAFNASTLGQGTSAVGNAYAGFASVPAGGCQGPGFDVSRVDQEFADAHATYAPLETCDGLGQKVSDFARPWFVAGIWMAVAFTVYYVISKSIGAPD